MEQSDSRGVPMPLTVARLGFSIPGEKGKDEVSKGCSATGTGWVSGPGAFIKGCDWREAAW